ncbi:MAG: hypothetical protein JRG94_05400, partial [Deltaproteobacteria bacterium]|nr:hypothetical protein [Deltaproteobacteria bacterium]
KSGLDNPDNNYYVALIRDDRYHFMISTRDPGIQNWLDVEQHRRGLIMMRWQGLEASLPEEAQPRAQLVSFDEIHERLPKDVPRFNEAQRRQQIRTRRANVHRRFDG